MWLGTCMPHRRRHHNGAFSPGTYTGLGDGSACPSPSFAAHALELRPGTICFFEGCSHATFRPQLQISAVLFKYRPLPYTVLDSPANLPGRPSSYPRLRPPLPAPRERTVPEHPYGQSLQGTTPGVPADPPRTRGGMETHLRRSHNVSNPWGMRAWGRCARVAHPVLTVLTVLSQRRGGGQTSRHRGSRGPFPATRKG